MWCSFGIVLKKQSKKTNTQSKKLIMIYAKKIIMILTRISYYDILSVAKKWKVEK